MTILGKILVFVNLVLSLVTAWFIAMTFTRDVNWKSAADTWAARVKVTEADARALKEDFDQRTKDKDGQLGKLQLQYAGLQNDLTNKDKEIAEKEAAVIKLQTLNQQFKANNDTNLAEMARIKNERNKMQGELDQKRTAILSLQKQMQQVRDDAVAKQIAYLSEKRLNEKLQTENERITQENDHIKNNGSASASSAGAATTTVAKPPPEDIEGYVTETDSRDGLVTLSIGSDNGLSRGQALEVFRLKPRPEYVGRILILDARPHEAVARAIAPLRAGPVRKGDQVASHVGVRK